METPGKGGSEGREEDGLWDLVEDIVIEGR